MANINDHSIQMFFIDGKFELGVMGSGKRFEIEGISSFISHISELLKNKKEEKLEELVTSFGAMGKGRDTFTPFACVSTFLRLLKEDLYVNYSEKEKVERWDREKSKDDFEKGMIKSAGDVDNNNDFSCDTSLAPCEEIEAIVGSCFRPISKASFYGIYDVLLTPVPSNGARHPFYPCFAHQGKLYRYSPQNDIFSLLDRKAEDDDTLFFLVCDFEVMQVRYPNSIAYNDILLEQGHIESNLKLKGHEYGFCLKKIVYKKLKEINKSEDVFNVYKIIKTKKVNTLEDVFRHHGGRDYT